MAKARKGVERPNDAAAGEKPDAGAGPLAAEPAEFAGLSFETSLERLEGVVDLLEQGDLELEKSLDAFEQGVRLSARCSELLASAEQRVELLTQEGENWVSRSFESQAPPSGSDAADALGEPDESNESNESIG